MATQQVNDRLAALTAAGTSIWLDQIKRALISTGELQRLVEEDSLRGVTSNPTIFNAAILGSDDYDDQLAELALAGKDNREIYQELAIRDIQDACDVLRVVYDESGGTDGFVSFEVDPDLAFDTHRTIEQAREYWDRVDRPNLMIKIPGTKEGTPAIEEMIYEGRNINVTCSSASRSTRRWPRPTSAAWSAASRRASRSTSTRWRRSSSRAWTPRSTSALRALITTSCSARPASPTPAPPTSATRTSSSASASPPCRAPAPPYSACCGPRPASRTRPTAT
jgi:hypothetical protein